MTTTHARRRREQRLAVIALQLPRITSLLAKAQDAAQLTLPDGYGSGGGLEPVSGGGTSRPVEAAILERERILESREGDDEARRVGLAAVDTSLTVIEAALREIQTELTAVAARAHDGLERQRTNMADCEACGRCVAQTTTDRIKAGYCRACYEAWKRADRPDRPTFERTRRYRTDPAA